MAATDFQVTGTYTYTGAAQAPTVVATGTAATAGYIGDITVTTSETNAGTYNAVINVAEGSDYAAATGITLSDAFVIGQKEVELKAAKTTINARPNVAADLSGAEFSLDGIVTKDDANKGKFTMGYTLDNAGTTGLTGLIGATVTAPNEGTATITATATLGAELSGNYKFATGKNALELTLSVVDKTALNGTFTNTTSTYGSVTAPTYTPGAGQDAVTSKLVYKADGASDWSDEMPTAPGSHQVKAVATGESAADYGESVPATFTVNKKPITITLTATKAYDGTDDGEIGEVTNQAVTAGGLVDGDAVTVDTITGAMYGSADAHAEVTAGTITSATFTGTNNTYYDVNLAFQGTITPKPITLDSATITKAYDGKTDFAVGEITAHTWGGVLNSDDPAITAAAGAAYASAEAGSTTITGCTAVTIDNGNYSVAASELNGKTATITKSAAVFTFGNLSQTVGSVTAVTATTTITSENANDAVTVEYKIPVADTVAMGTLTDCDCGAADHLAHASDCAYVVDQTANCNCGYTNGNNDDATVHEDGCAYKLSAPNAHCDCTVLSGSSLTNVSDHQSGCAALSVTSNADEWKKWDEKPTDYASVSAYLNTLPAGTHTGIVRASVDGTGNFSATTSSDQDLTLTVYTPPTGGGGSGVSKYTVRYEAGKNGALAKGSKTSESVKKGEKPVNVPEVVADEGYVFLGWTVKGSDDIVKPAETEITKAVTFVATFAEKGAVHTVYVNGVGDGKFNPEGTMTRAEAAAMLARLHDEWTGEPGSTVFTDVPADAWYAAAVTFAADKGIIEGRGEGVFDPTASISRAEFAAMLCRFMGLETDGQSAGFSDTQGTWADAYITALKTAGVADGYVDGTFRPENPVARAEAVKLINGALGRTPDKDLVDENLAANPFTDVAADYWAFADIMEAAVDHLGRDFHPAEKPAEK